MATQAASALSRLFQERTSIPVQDNDSVYDDGFVIVDDGGCAEEPPSYSEAVSEPPPPYTPGADSQFLDYANATLPSYQEISGNETPSYAATTSSSASTNQSTSNKYITNYALNSIPFAISPSLQLQLFVVPAPPVISMRNYWYDFSFERTFLRDFDTSYSHVQEFDFEFGGSRQWGAERLQLDDEGWQLDEGLQLDELRVALPKEEVQSSRSQNESDLLNLISFD